MQLPTFLSLLLTLGGAAHLVLGRSLLLTTTTNNNKVIPRQEPVDRYICDYRVFGAVGCFEKNEGVGTITSSQLGQCMDWGLDIKAVNLTKIIDGCSFHVYYDHECGGGHVQLTMGKQCGAEVEDEEKQVWGSYKATCP